MGHVNCIEGLPASQGFEPVRIDRRKRLHRIAIRCGRCESGAASRTRPQLVTLEDERHRILQASRAVTEKVTA